MNTLPRILLVEDDKNFGEVLRSYLEDVGNYTVSLAADGREGAEAFRQGRFDLCILDVMMPFKDGYTLAREIRQQSSDVPIIFITARTQKEDVLEGFRSGADDYISKPFNSEELLFRIQAVLKRSLKDTNTSVEEAKEFTIGAYQFNYPFRTLTLHGDSESAIRLSPKEADLLRLFCLHLNQILPRSEALNKIWGEDSYFTARSMDVFITKLRKYLKDDPNVEIVNIHGNGFQLKVLQPQGTEQR